MDSLRDYVGVNEVFDWQNVGFSMVFTLKEEGRGKGKCCYWVDEAVVL